MSDTPSSNRVPEAERDILRVRLATHIAVLELSNRIASLFNDAGLDFELDEAVDAVDLHVRRVIAAHRKLKQHYRTTRAATKS